MRQELHARMRRDQRHRLLQGYPMAPLMKPFSQDTAGPRPVRQPHRPLIVGVLPHPFCNPRVRGCGFCTFPHERFTNAAARETTRAVATEVRAHGRGEPVEALYLGGGTANLTPPDVFAELCDALSGAFSLTDAEVSLEGVPAYFLTRDARLLSLLAERLPARHHRISMGIQTFDAGWRRRMGREAFGDASTVARVVARARRLGIGTSGDLLMNLPGQRVEDTLEDLRIADGLGLDQICLYHLVLYEGLGTEWSKDADLLEARVDTEEACARWLEARAFLLERGFVQTTLTNFERREVHESSRAFAYERLSFEPWARDGLGFGPGAISTVLSSERGPGLKWINRASAASYVDAVRGGAPLAERSFPYEDPRDLSLLFLTRGLARGWVDLSHVPLTPHQRAALHSCEVEGLLALTDEVARLTPRGMFFADSVTGFLAARRARELAGPRRRHLPLNDARPHGMG